MPSDPTKSEVRSYPAELFGAKFPVSIKQPSASTTPKLSTLLRMLPNLTFVVPLALVAAIPASDVLAPGLTGKAPVVRICCLKPAS